MTSLDLRAALQSLGWSGRDLARRCGVGEGTPRNWLSGRYPIPPAIAEWLADLAPRCEPHTAAIAREVEALEAIHAACPCPAAPRAAAAAE